jgi:predicted PurR-regulated permease PerM
MFENSRVAKLLVVAASFVVVVAGMRFASPIIVPFLLAVFITIITTPLFITLLRWGIPTPVTLAILIVLIFVIGLFGIGIVGQSISELSRNLTDYQQRLEAVIDGAADWLASVGIQAPESAIEEALNAKNIMKIVGGVLGGFRSLFGNALIIFLIVVFMLLEVAFLPSRIKNLPGITSTTYEYLEAVVDNLRGYMGIKTVMSLVTGAAVGVFTALMGVDYAILLGLLAFLLNYVPSIGSIIAAVPGILLALIQYGFGRMVIVAIGYIAINGIVSNLVEPRFVGRKLGLSPVIVIVSLIFWGWVLGPVGMLLSVPLTMTVKIAMESADETKWISILMG